jgi:hypothetical protein
VSEGVNMTRLIIALTLVAIATTANAITDYACVSDCTGRGNLYKDCMPECTYDYTVQTGTLKAIFTGQSERITVPNGLPANKCVYIFNGETILKIFERTCPSTIDVGQIKSKLVQPSPTPSSPTPSSPTPSPSPPFFWNQ